MKVLVTGATGFIGSNLVKRVLGDGFDVLIVKRINSSLEKIEDILDHERLKIYDISSTNLEYIFQKEKIDAIFHLATFYQKKEKSLDIQKMIRSNIEWPTLILQKAVESGVKYFINTGTFFEYRLNREVPISEESELAPYNLYASTKIAFENILRYYVNLNKMKAITLKLFAPYGPYDNPNKIIPFLIKKMFKKEPITLHSSGMQKWDYIFVLDIVDAYVKALNYVQHMKNKYEVFNIGDGKTVTIYEITNILKRLIGYQNKIIWSNDSPHEIKYVCANIEKAKQILGWNPHYDIEKGLKATVKWYINDGAKDEN